MVKLEKEKRIETDNTIKDYIGKIRQVRDCMYERELLPKEAKVEISKYKPMLWTRRRQRRNVI